MKKEYRHLQAPEFRAINDDQSLTLEGYAILFNEPSQDMGFFEVVHPGALNKTLKESKNIRALFEHDSKKILGSTKNETLKLTTDEKGLKFSLRINPQISWAKDTFELVKAGEISGMSFGFKAIKDDWEKDKAGTIKRNLRELRLFEISVVSEPAYEATSVDLRSYIEEVSEEKEELIHELETLGILVESRIAGHAPVVEPVDSPAGEETTSTTHQEDTQDQERLAQAEDERRKARAEIEILKLKSEVKNLWKN